ncbi:DJ-1 family glyoxalase III [Oscillospiraceae bacterium 50-58]
MVYILLAPGFEETEALVPVDMLRRANIETATVSITGEPVPGSHGVTVLADVTLDDVDLSRADMIVLPGGGPGYKNLGKEPRVEQLVRKAAEKGLWVAAICAAPTLLGRWGLLEGKNAVCYPGMEEGLTGAQPQMDQGVVVAGKVITGRAAGSAFDFGLTLVETLAGKEESDKVRHGIYY